MTGEKCRENSLDGLTILRFAHAFEKGAGVEQYIEDLDRMLLERNRVNILRMYLSEDFGQAREKREKIGQGSLVKIPLKIANKAQQTDADKQKKTKPKRLILNNLLRDWVV